MRYVSVDLYTTPEFPEKAKADFEKIREPLEFVTLIPEGQNAPSKIH